MCDVCEERYHEADDQRIVVRGLDGEPVRWLAVYELNLASGGPEEGGWWYTEGTLIDLRVVPQSPVWDQVFETTKAELIGQYPAEGERPLHSVAYDGGAHEVRITNDGKIPWEHTPYIRPHYE